MAASASIQQPDYAAIKQKQNAAWSSGDYARIGVTLQLAGEMLAETMDLGPDAQALDVAAGNGNATLALARRGARVTSTDYVPALLEKGAERAAVEGFEVAFQQGRCGSAALRRRLVRRGRLDLRRDVCAEPGAGGARNDASLPSGRGYRSCELDRGQLYRRAL